MKILKKTEGKKFFLITDLSLVGTDLKRPEKKLSTEEANKFSIEVLKELEKELKKYDCKIMVIDHHASGKNEAEEFDWYKLDTKNSATMATYNYFLTEHPELKDIKELVYSIDNYDIYKEHNSKYFLQGAMFQQISMKSLSLFPDEVKMNVQLQRVKAKYINYLFDKINSEYLPKVEDIGLNTLNFEIIPKLQLEYIQNMLEEVDKDKIENNNLTLEEKIKYAKNIITSKYMIENVAIFDKLFGGVSNFLENDKNISYEEMDLYINKTIFSMIKSFHKKNLKFLEKYTTEQIEIMIKDNNNKEALKVQQILREKELLANPYIPYDMLSSMVFGPSMIKENIQKNVKVEELNTVVSIVTDIPSNIYQHSVFEASTYKKQNVFLKIDYTRGSCSIRSKNGKANIIAGIFGGGGHPDAGGCFIPPKTVLGEDYFEKYKNMTEEEKENEKEFLKEKYLNYIHKHIEEAYPSKNIKNINSK